MPDILLNVREKCAQSAKASCLSSIGQRGTGNIRRERLLQDHLAEPRMETRGNHSGSCTRRLLNICTTEVHPTHRTDDALETATITSLS